MHFLWMGEVWLGRGLAEKRLEQRGVSQCPRRVAVMTPLLSHPSSLIYILPLFCFSYSFPNALTLHYGTNIVVTSQQPHSPLTAMITRIPQ